MTMKRNTKQKNAIRNVFIKYTRPLTIQEILEYGQLEVPTLNQATVYRNLDRLAKDGLVVKVEYPKLGVLYELAEKDHHHHFHCLKCDKLLELPGCPLEEDHHAPKGFSVKGHELVLFGTCPDCAK